VFLAQTQIRRIVIFYKHSYRVWREACGGREKTVKITRIETLRTEEFANVLWVRLHTDAGIIGLGETFYGAGAVEAHIHDTLASRLIGRDPLQIEAIHRDLVNLPMAQSSTGVEYRAASAVDIALWDIFGKVCKLPVHQMLGGLCREKQRIYNTCAGYRYVRSNNIRPVSNWNAEDDEGPYEDLNGFMNRADAVAESLLESGITAMKIWPFDPAAQDNQGMSISVEELKRAVEPFEKIRKAVGDKIEIMVEFHSLWNLPMAKKIAKILEPYNPTWYEDPIKMNSPQALAEYARSTDVWVCASETLGTRWAYKDMLERDATHVVMVDLCWTGGLTEGKKIAALAETFHRPFAPHDCIGPVGFIAAVHASFSQPNTLIQESVRAFYTGWYNELVTNVPVIKDGYVYPMEGYGLCVELRPEVFERPDLHVRRSEA
jgi:galactonate dehydratase